MDWFLYDDGLRHERVKLNVRRMRAAILRSYLLIHLSLTETEL